MTSALAMQVWLVAGDCFLIGLAPVLVHMSKGPDGKFPFHPVSINLLVEVAKTVFATIILMIYVSPHPCPSCLCILLSSVKLSRMRLLLCIPYGMRYAWNLVKEPLPDAACQAGCRARFGTEEFVPD